jgi:hypothetical protein
MQGIPCAGMLFSTHNTVHAPATCMFLRAAAAKDAASNLCRCKKISMAACFRYCSFCACHDLYCILLLCRASS